MIFKQNKWHFESLSEAARSWIDKFVFHIESPFAHIQGYKFKWDLWKALRKRGEAE